MSYIDTILDLAAKKAKAAEVFHARTETTAAAWNADKLKIAEVKETMGVALRVLIDGKIGFFATNKLDDPAKIVDTACELAKFGLDFAGMFPDELILADVDIFHKPTASLPLEMMIESGNNAISAVKDAKPEAIFEAKLERDIVWVEIANSFGARAEYQKTGFSGYLYGSITKEGDVLNIYDFGASTAFEEQPDEWARNLMQAFKNAENIIDLPTGEYQCIVTPKATGFLGPLKMALNARSVLKDMSPFKDKVGERVFDERIMIIDDGLNHKMPATQPMDDEGVMSRQTTLVENGILKGFVHDLNTAALMKVSPTGNGMKGGLSSAPRAAYTTLSFKPGGKSTSDLIASVKKGIIVDQIMGAHQASPFSGDFSVSVDLGYVIENGQIIGRFKDSMLSGNLFSMLKNQILEIGKEARYVEHLIPPVLFDKMAVATNA